MITLYVDLDSLFNDFVRPNLNLVRDADTYFNQKVRSGEIRIKDCKRFIELLTSERGTIKREQDLLKLSTSCKTLILADKYPDIILSNQNISAEASSYMLALFSERNQAFLFYPNRQTVKFSLIVGEMGCQDKPSNILSYDDEICATVVGGLTKKVCNTYGEIFSTIQEFAEPEEENIFPGRLTYIEDKTEMGQDGVRLCREANISPFRNCNLETCKFRIQSIANGFIFGGQFICRAIYDPDLNRVLEVASPFGVEPTIEQLDAMFDYAYEVGLISFEGTDDKKEICYSDAIITSLTCNTYDDEIAGYIMTKDGVPQLTGSFIPNRKQKESLIEDDFIFGYGIEEDEEEENEEPEEPEETEETELIQ